MSKKDLLIFFLVFCLKVCINFNSLLTLMKFLPTNIFTKWTQIRGGGQAVSTRQYAGWYRGGVSFKFDQITLYLLRYTNCKKRVVSS